MPRQVRAVWQQKVYQQNIRQMLKILCLIGIKFSKQKNKIQHITTKTSYQLSAQVIIRACYAVRRIQDIAVSE